MARVIGITGGAGAGKTTFVRRWQQKGIPVVVADEVGRKVVQKGSPVLRALAATFGKTVLTKEGTLNRQKVGQWVFQNPSALRRLNQLTHPPMRRIIYAAVREWEGRGAKVVGVEAAVLFEMGLQRLVDEVWVMTASERERLKRLERLGWRRETVWRRIRRQVPDEVFKRRAHRVIVTDGSAPKLTQSGAGTRERVRRR